MSSEVGVTDCKNCDVIQKVEIMRHAKENYCKFFAAETSVEFLPGYCTYTLNMSNCILEGFSNCFLLRKICTYHSCIKTISFIIHQPIYDIRLGFL